MNGKALRTYKRKRPQCQIIEGVKDLCRLCLTKTETVVPIFENDSDPKSEICSSLSTRIMLCVGLEVTKEQQLPNKICDNCYKKIESCYAFRKMCEMAYLKLKLHLQAVKMKEINQMMSSQEQTVKDDASVTNYPGLQDKASEVSPNNTLQVKQTNLSLLIKNNVNTENLPTVIKNDNIIKGGVLQGCARKLTLAGWTDFDEILCVHSSRIENCLDTQLDSVVGSAVKLQQEQQVSSVVIPKSVDISTFIVTELLETDILSVRGEQLVLSEDTNTEVELVAEDGSVVTLLLEEEEENQKDAVARGITIESINPDSSLSFISHQIVDKSQLPIVFEKSEYACPLCHKVFSKACALRRHARVHSGARPYVCRRCGRAFSQNCVLRRHELLHLERRPWRCARCPKSFTQRAALVSHSRLHAGQTRLTLHPCRVCTKVFLHGSGVSRHMQQAHGSRVFMCGECARQFRDKSSLRRHLRTHRDTAGPEGGHSAGPEGGQPAV